MHLNFLFPLLALSRPKNKAEPEQKVKSVVFNKRYERESKSTMPNKYECEQKHTKIVKI